ncbi:MAG TPA: S9 family peptidase [Ktedonosporobacter sp.]|nr:S9 family peptidase [Ktedonosporobacter sp.]
MPELTADIIVDLKVPDDLQIKPDGKQVAYRLLPRSKKEEQATSAIWIASIDGTREARQFTRGDVEDKQPRWSPDGNQIAFLSDRAQRGAAQLYIIPADGGEARALTSIKNKKGVNDFAWSPGGGQIAFTSADEPTEEDEKREKDRDDARVYGEKWPYAQLRLLSLASGEVTTLVSGERHIAEFTWHPKGTEIAYVVHQTPDLEAIAHEIIIERIPIAGGEPKTICRFPLAIDSLLWSQDREVLYFIASVAKKSQSSKAIYAVAASGGEPQHIIGGETNCMAGLRLLQQEQHIAVMIGEGLESHLCHLDTKSGKIVTLLTGTDGGKGVGYGAWDVRSSKDGKIVVAVTRSTGDQPWEVWAGKGEQEQIIEIQPVSTHQEQLTGIVFGKQEPFYWTGSDGLELDGLLIRPPNATEGQSLPMVVLVHGGPYSRWGHGFNLHGLNWGQWLALAGYAVLMPNPRGGFGHGEKFAAAARGAVGMADYQDVMAAVDAAIERGIADPEKLGIGGWSQGGFMSAWAITQTQRFKAAVMGAGVSDWGMMVLTSDLPDFEQELGGSTPWDGEEHRRHLELSPITFARNVKTPVLILHGEKDARVPLSQAIAFHRALRRHGIPAEFVTYPREPHGVSERMHLIDLLKRVRRWYDKWLRT